METIFSNFEAQQYLGVNRYQDILWYNREAFVDLIWWLYVTAIVHCVAHLPADQVAQAVIKRYSIIHQIQQASAESSYQVEKLLSSLKKK